jgi:uncharacterized membrane protein
MDGSNPRSTARIFGHPIHPMLVPFPITFFICTLGADVVGHFDADGPWATVARWLLGAGLITAALAALAGLADFAGDRRVRALHDAQLHMAGNILAVLIEAANFILRLDGAERASNTEIALSAIAVALLAFTGWKGGELVFRHRVGVRDDGTGPG